MNDATNVLVMVPLCFTAFGSLVSILGLIGARCSNKWLVFGHSSLALPCIVGFAAVGIITGIWLAGFEILELSLNFLACSIDRSNYIVFDSKHFSTLESHRKSSKQIN